MGGIDGGSVEDPAVARQDLEHLQPQTLMTPAISLSPFHRSAACIIAKSVAQPEPFAVPALVPPLHRRTSSLSAIASLEG